MSFMRKRLGAVLAACLMVSVAFGCGAEGPVIETVAEPVTVTESVVPEPEETDWEVVSTDAEAFGIEGGIDNPRFEEIFMNTSTVPLDQLIAFALVADGLSEGACDQLYQRFLEAPHVVLAYLALMGEQPSVWEGVTAAEAVCSFIASADAVWYGGTEEFHRVLTECRAFYPKGRVAELLDCMEVEHAASMEQNGG